MYPHVITFAQCRDHGGAHAATGTGDKDVVCHAAALEEVAAKRKRR
jgi:hypothetical protein